MATFLPSLSVAGKVALVTGGSRGIGRAIALGLAEAGADVAVASRSVPQLEAVAQEIRSLGRRCLVIQADTTAKPQVEAMVNRTVAELGAIDILINNAGVLVRRPLMETSEADWDWIMDTNLKGYFLCSQAVGKLIRHRQQGVIVNLASAGACKVNPATPAYCVSKAGVAMLTKALALELAPHVRVNAVAPSLVKTDINRYIWQDPAAFQARLRAAPLGRIAELKDVVGAVLFLASEASSYITGHLVAVEGGITL